ncbi:MAG: ATP synthase F1 subunit epsilon, partial [Firmicutes bacterium]|nr:ATP synthase F1 subunit epsilon [Bacillota bacterium]
DRQILKQEVSMIIVRTTEGEIGVLAHHMPLVSPLVPHLMTVVAADESRQYWIIGGGFLQVTPDGVIVLADAADRPDEVDLALAQKEREAALEVIGRPAPDVELARAKRALARAEARLRYAKSVH